MIQIRTIVFSLALLFAAGLCLHAQRQEKPTEEMQHVLVQQRIVSDSLVGAAIIENAVIRLNFLPTVDTVMCGTRRVRKAYVRVRLHLEGTHGQYRWHRRNYSGTVTINVSGTSNGGPQWGTLPYVNRDLTVVSDSLTTVQPELHHRRHEPPSEGISRRRFVQGC